MKIRPTKEWCERSAEIEGDSEIGAGCPPTTCSALPRGVKVRPTRRSLDRFRYFSACEDDKRLPAIPFVAGGWTAAECFHVWETYGKLIECREPVLLSRALNGKEWHGVDVTHLAEDYVGRSLFASEIKANYPEWVQRDILGRATQIAMRDLGYVPTFVRTGEDSTTLSLHNDQLRHHAGSAGRNTNNL